MLGEGDDAVGESVRRGDVNGDGVEDELGGCVDGVIAMANAWEGAVGAVQERGKWLERTLPGIHCFSAGCVPISVLSGISESYEWSHQAKIKGLE